MILTKGDLKNMNPHIEDGNIEKYLDYLNYYMNLYNIDNENEVASYISNISHESANFSKLKENLNYSSKRLLEVFPKYFPNKEIADKYANKPLDIGNRVYANRMGNGDEASGDGYKYSGKGLLMHTGRDQYQWLGEKMRADLLSKPELLTVPKYAVWASCLFWEKNKLNNLC